MLRTFDLTQSPNCTTFLHPNSRFPPLKYQKCFPNHILETGSFWTGLNVGEIFNHFILTQWINIFMLLWPIELRGNSCYKIQGKKEIWENLEALFFACHLSVRNAGWLPSFLEEIFGGHFSLFSPTLSSDFLLGLLNFGWISVAHVVTTGNGAWSLESKSCRLCLDGHLT